MPESNAEAFEDANEKLHDQIEEALAKGKHDKANRLSAEQRRMITARDGNQAVGPGTAYPGKQL